MRTTGEILDAIATGEVPTHEECYWALQAISMQLNTTMSKYHEQVFSPKADGIAKAIAETNFQSAKRCMAANPQKWVGPDFDYRDPANRKRREISLKLFDKAMKGELPNQKSDGEGQ